MNLLSKFLLIAKSCYEQRNFATAMQILGGLEHLAVRQSPVSSREGRAHARKWAPHGRRAFTSAFILGLENLTRKDSGGHGGAESCGGTSALQGLPAACVQLGFSLTMCSARLWGAKPASWPPDHKVPSELCTASPCGTSAAHLGSGGRGALGALSAGRVHRVQVPRGPD